MSQTDIHEHPAAVEAVSPHPHHDRGLIAIAIFKLAKSAFFFCIGIGAIHLLHKDLGDVALRLARALHRDPDGQFVGFILRQVDKVDAHRLREIGIASYAYSALALTEGIGLMLEKVWAEYLTLSLTLIFLPWELYEIIRRPDALHASLLLANLAVLAYLIWLLRQKKQSEL